MPLSRRAVFTQHLLHARCWAHARSQADTAPAPRRPTCRRARDRGGGLRAGVRPAVETLRRGCGARGGWRGSGEERFRRGSGRGRMLRALGPVGHRHARWAQPAGDGEAGVPSGVEGLQGLHRVHLAPWWCCVGSGPGARQVQPIVCSEPGARPVGDPREGAGAAKAEGAPLPECLRAGPCGGLGGRA